ncbi:hypothetical protein DPMN_068328 [Dreissena polymorpha]|uniref:Uncharacterized protein n=1 Tax=Dreissena polymorpha TaxID=45954 RepID=A0A9D3Z2C5_DREPO|nr:hypothetical protein DPMN_068328 [Dreissena polymorpha]
MDNEVVPYQKPVAESSYTFLDVELDEQITYQAKVRICNNIRCLRPIESNIFTVDKEVTKLSVTNAELNVTAAGDCVHVKASWEFTGNVARIGFVQWALSRDNKGGHLLSVWNNVVYKGSGEMKVMLFIDSKMPLIYDKLIVCCKNIFYSV